MCFNALSSSNLVLSVSFWIPKSEMEATVVNLSVNKNVLRKGRKKFINEATALLINAPELIHLTAVCFQLCLFVLKIYICFKVVSLLACFSKLSCVELLVDQLQTY